MVHNTESCTSHFAGAAVHAELEVLGMEMIRDGVQTVWEFVVVQL
jgi:hypothetical protein